MESSRQRCQIFARQLLVWRFLFFWKRGVMRRQRSTFFGCFALEVGFFAGSSQERVAPRAREGARQSWRVWRAAPQAARLAGGPGRRDTVAAGRAGPNGALFLVTRRRPALSPPHTPGARFVGLGIPGAPDSTLSCCAFHHCSFTSPLAPTFPSLDIHTHTHTSSLDSSSTSPCSLGMIDACRLSPTKRWGQQTTTVI